MGRLSGKTAIITGGARGQGRAHAVKFAAEGANIVICDVPGHTTSAPYELATHEDMDETVALVEKVGRTCIAIEADVRSAEAMNAVADRAVAEFGGVDILAANAGIAPVGNWDADPRFFQEAMDVNVTGVLVASRAVIPHMIARGGGSIIMTSSALGVRAAYNMIGYGTSKHAVVGLMRNLSAELAPHRIRVNTILPGCVDTPMMTNDFMLNLFAGTESGAKVSDIGCAVGSLVLLPVSLLEPEAVSNAALFLASDESEFITGIELPVDAGQTNQPSGVPLNSHITSVV